MSEEPRAYTPEECREKMFTHMALTLKYWRDLPVDQIRAHMTDGKTETHARMEGFLFSLLTMFDGSTMSVPGLDIVPAAHPDDAEYHKSQGENWWPAEVINNLMMHEVFPWDKCK